MYLIDEFEIFKTDNVSDYFENGDEGVRLLSSTYRHTKVRIKLKSLDHNAFAKAIDLNQMEIEYHGHRYQIEIVDKLLSYDYPNIHTLEITGYVKEAEAPKIITEI